MSDRDRYSSHQRDEEDYEQDEYDEYEEEASEHEELEEDPKPSKEEQEFLKEREQMKEEIRQKMKKQSASVFGHSIQSQDRKMTGANDKFGSFFGPSKPVIAPRVLEERRSIRETQHIVAKIPSSYSSQNKRDSISTSISTSTEIKAHTHDQQRKIVKEVKNKAQTLKNMRDYSFLLSDDADLPTPAEEQPAPRKVPVLNSGNANRPATTKEQLVPRKFPVLNSDGRSVQATLKSKVPAGKPAKLVANGHEKNSASASQQMQSKVAPREPLMNRPKLASVESRKRIGVDAGNGSGQPARHKVLPSKISAPATGAIRPPAKVVNGHNANKKSLSAKPHSSIQNHQSEQKRIIQGQDKVKIAPKQPLPSSKVQSMKPVKQIQSRGIREDHPRDRPKKRPFRRDEEDDADDAIQMIRNMFRYNPSRFAGVDDQDDSDMEVGFDSIMEEERRSAKIARKEDEEQLRLIEEEERREMMRKKQKKMR